MTEKYYVLSQNKTNLDKCVTIN